MTESAVWLEFVVHRVLYLALIRVFDLYSIHVASDSLCFVLFTGFIGQKMSRMMYAIFGADEEFSNAS